MLISVIALPSLTWTEQISFEIWGQQLNVRFALYLAVAVLSSGAAGVALLLRLTGRPIWVLAAATFLGWLVVTSLLAGQPTREWLPTLVRWSLYLSALILSFVVVDRLLPHKADAEAVEKAVVVLAITATAVPILAGLTELITNSAPMLNGAPRISGTMARHPVAYSLLIMLGALLVWPTAIGSSSRPARAVLIAYVVIALTLVLFTFTRLTIVLMLVAGITSAVALATTNRVRVARLAMGAIVSAIVLALAFPFFQARVAETSKVIVGGSGGSGETPSNGGSPPSEPTVIEVDNSTLLRLQIHQHGLEYVGESPVVGHGPGSFDRLFEEDTGKSRVAAHDEFLLYAVETGVPGLVLYLIVIGTIGYAMRPARWASPAAARLAGASGVALAAIGLGAAFHNPSYFPEIMTLAFVSAGASLGVMKQTGAKL